MIVNDVTFDQQCNKLCFAVLNNIAQLKFEFKKKKKKKILKIRIKDSFSILFSPIING